MLDSVAIVGVFALASLAATTGERLGGSSRPFADLEGQAATSGFAPTGEQVNDNLLSTSGDQLAYSQQQLSSGGNFNNWNHLMARLSALSGLLKEHRLQQQQQHHHQQQSSDIQVEAKRQVGANSFPFEVLPSAGSERNDLLAPPVYFQPSLAPQVRDYLSDFKQWSDNLSNPSREGRAFKPRLMSTARGFGKRDGTHSAHALLASGNPSGAIAADGNMSGDAIR